MSFKDPVKRREYQREYNKRRRGGLSKNLATHLIRLETAYDLRVLLEEVITEVRASDLNTEPKARILLEAVKTGIKIIEVTNLETRLRALEFANNGDVVGNMRRDESEADAERVSYEA